MYACVTVSYNKISFMAFALSKIEMVKCCDSSFLFLEVQFMNLICWLTIHSPIIVWAHKHDVDPLFKGSKMWLRSLVLWQIII